MAISQRQMELIQGAAQVLMEDLNLTRDEVLQLITTELKVELKREHTSMEELNYRERSERTLFVRHVVAGVQKQLAAKRQWSQTQLDKSIRKFMHILHESWEKENEKSTEDGNT